METTLHEDKTFDKIVYANKVIKGREFQNCIFKNCDLSNSNFSHSKFLDCVFLSCNLSMIKMTGTTLSNVIFKDCKILAVNFNDCENFLFSILRVESCNLDFTSFVGKKMLKTEFIKSSMKEANFEQANLAGSVFDQVDLSSAAFYKTDLTSTDFTTAYNFDIDPESNTLKKASFSMEGLPGLLRKYGLKINQ
jgi:fluoroquinolone resistance protein